jgi:hypothetical protein
MKLAPLVEEDKNLRKVFPYFKKDLEGREVKLFEDKPNKTYLGFISKVEFVHNPDRIVVHFYYTKACNGIVTNYNITTYINEYIQNEANNYGLHHEVYLQPHRVWSTDELDTIIYASGFGG